MTHAGGRRRTWRKLNVVSTEIMSALPSKQDRVRLSELMWRWENDCLLPRDHKKLTTDIHELRLTVAGREFRLYFAEVDGSAVALALHFKGKKKQRDPGAISLAADRLRTYRQSL